MIIPYRVFRWLVRSQVIYFLGIDIAELKVFLVVMATMLRGKFLTFDIQVVVLCRGLVNMEVPVVTARIRRHASHVLVP
jgi:hypothetical protein